jgi:hypothetical protein
MDEFARDGHAAHLARRLLLLELTASSQTEGATMSASLAMSSLPTRAQLQRGVDKIAPVMFNPEESLVNDERSGVRPAQMVERKLTRLTQNSILFVSHLRLKGMILPRG